jgi:hypothetical protein
MLQITYSEARAILSSQYKKSFFFGFINKVFDASDYLLLYNAVETPSLVKVANGVKRRVKDYEGVDFSPQYIISAPIFLNKDTNNLALPEQFRKKSVMIATAPIPLYRPLFERFLAENSMHLVFVSAKNAREIPHHFYTDVITRDYDIPLW